MIKRSSRVSNFINENLINDDLNPNSSDESDSEFDN